ncbi:MAG: ABC transporter permease [Actinomycetota bacterium]|nr:ABC transporter permease [Actinomycetota bacterium]
MIPRLSRLFYVLAALSAAAALAGVVLGAEWIEELTGLEPDAGSGALELLLVVVPAVAAVVFGLLGRRWQRVAD